LDRWTEVELFIKTVELGSISKAAVALNMSSTAASRYLGDLERRLNVRLLERNTRRQYLTEIGEQFYQRSKESMTIMADAEAAVSVDNDALFGTLSISASVTFCVKQLGPIVAAFSALYPDLVIKLVAENYYSDLIADNIDVAVRTRQYEPHSNIVVRKLAESKVMLCATPEYLSTHGVPAHPNDLDAHRLLVYNHATSVADWTFRRADEVIAYRPKASIEANDGLTLRSTALSHTGILFQAYYGIYDDIANGDLVRVLPDWELPNLVCNVAYRNRRFVPGKVRRFISFMQAQFKQLCDEERWLAS
jgi:DNA-binding transcriptional LysR family regulator